MSLLVPLTSNYTKASVPLDVILWSFYQKRTILNKNFICKEDTVWLSYNTLKKREKSLMYRFKFNVTAGYWLEIRN